jgi:hypothetical protein
VRGRHRRHTDRSDPPVHEFLVSFRQDQNDVTGLRLLERLPDRGLPVRNEGGIRTGYAAADALRDAGRILVAAVLFGQNDPVARRIRDLSEQGALFGVPLPGGSEYCKDAAAVPDGPRILEDLFESVRCVCVIDDDMERLSLVDPLDPAFHLGQVPDQRDQALERDPRFVDGGQHGQEV